ncbi:MAG TPA: hypothetical protein H9754_00760 [Candidatus Anaerostipes avistercoris]|uniref:Uncharacterized protein n=1 Tax=Candidatus Anaerostipes avistercoris TaxID=2838462 RepID=A0A9D2PE52_9FIRM|nr:hypothetical protein [Candidatus Anaerostipes avistercoris]
MAYEDIYNGLTDEERERMIKADIPKFRTIGEANLSKEKLEQGEKDLLRLMEEFDNDSKNDIQ